LQMLMSPTAARVIVLSMISRQQSIAKG
jgi:hypothetical protein